MPEISNGLWKENCVSVARSLSGFDEMPGLPSGSIRKADEDPDAKTSRGQAHKCHHDKKCPKGIAQQKTIPKTHYQTKKNAFLQAVLKKRHRAKSPTQRNRGQAHILQVVFT